MKDKIATYINNFINEKITAIQASKYSYLIERARYTTFALCINAIEEIASQFKMQISEF